VGSKVELSKPERPTTDKRMQAMALEERLKQRLIGAAVLVALVVIFVPMLIDEPIDSKLVADHDIPEKPAALLKPSPEILPPVPAAKIDKRDGVPDKVPVASKPPPPDPLTDTTADKSERRSPSAWMIQVASLSVRKNAQKLVANLKKSDMPAQFDRVQIEGKTLYRVRVGPEVDFKTAERIVEQIKRKFKLKSKVMRYPE
jgi:DedD protein